MKFKIEHAISGISVPEYEALFFDEKFNVALCNAVKLDRTLIRRELKDGKLTRVLRLRPDREIPGPVAKVLGGAAIEYTEYTDYTWGSYRSSWRTESSILTDKIDSHGTILFEPRGSGVVRVVEGEIKVKIFGLGGIVERFIVSDIEKSYEQAAQFTRKWIAENGVKVEA